MVKFFIFVNHHEKIKEISLAKFFNFKKSFFEFFLCGGILLVNSLNYFEFHQFIHNFGSAEHNLIYQINDPVIDQSEYFLNFQISFKTITNSVSAIFTENIRDLLGFEERLKRKIESLNHIKDQKSVEEKREHFLQHIMLVIILEHKHLRSKDQREIGDKGKVDIFETIEHEFINQIDDFIVESHILVIDQEHERPENITWQKQIDQLMSLVIKLTLKN